MVYYRKKRYSKKTSTKKVYNPKTKRWQLSVGASYLGASANLKFNSRSFKRAVENVIEQHKEDKIIDTTFSNVALKHNTLYTMDVLQNIQFSTDPTLLNNPKYRNTNNIQPQSLRLVGNISWNIGTRTSDTKIMLIRSENLSFSNSTGSFYSGLGSSDLFRVTNSMDINRSIIDQRKIKVLKTMIITNRPLTSTIEDRRKLDFYYKFSKNDYEYLPGLNYGKFNYH